MKLYCMDCAFAECNNPSRFSAAPSHWMKCGHDRAYIKVDDLVTGTRLDQRSCREMRNLTAIPGLQCGADALLFKQASPK